MSVEQARADDAGFRQLVPYIPIRRGKRQKHPFTVHVRPNVPKNRVRAAVSK